MIEKKLSRQRIWQIKHKQLGLCRLCSHPIFPTSSLCKKHLISKRVAKRKKAGHSPWKKGSAGTPPKC